MATESAPAATEVTALDNAEGGATAALYAAAIGPVGAAYYQKVFAAMETAEGFAWRWNWAAALNTLNWMAFRRLWGAALAYCGIWVGAALLLFGIGGLILHLDAASEWALLAMLVLASVAVPGMLGNRWLYQANRKSVERALASHATLPEACAMLLASAPRRPRLLMLGLLNLGLAGAVIALWMLLPDAGQMPLGSSRMHEARGVVGPALELSKPVAPVASAPASAPVATASAVASNAAAASAAVMPAASAASATASTPATAVPAGAASSAAPSVPASSTVTAPPPLSKSPTSKPAAPSRTATAPLPMASIPLTAAPLQAPASAPSTKAAATPPAAPKAVASAPASAKAARTPAPGSTAQSTQFSVNVGVFADDNNALNAYTKLMDAGLPASSTVLNTAKGKRTRVRVGPFETEVQAERAADKIKALNLEAQVFRQ